MWGRVAFLLVMGAMSAPVAAQTASAIPEPSAIALFVLGVAGLVIGRSASRRGPRDDA